MYLINVYMWSMALSCVFHILIHTVTDETMEIGVTFEEKEIPYIVVFFIPVLNTILAMNGLLILTRAFMDKRN